MSGKKIKKEKMLLKKVRCKYCRSTENLTLDHKIPLSKGGKEELKNYQCLCKRCNSLKSSYTPAELRNLWKWYRLIERERAERKARPLISEEQVTKYQIGKLHTISKEQTLFTQQKENEHTYNS